MPARLTTLLIAALVGLLAPAAASAKSPSPNAIDGIPISKALYVQQGSALAMIQSMSSVPLGFSSSARQAVAAAERTPTLQALHGRMHPLQVYPYVWRGTHPYWYINFVYRGKLVASANVSPAGRATGAWTGRQAGAYFAHGGWSWSVTSWWIFVPASLLFMLVFFDPRRLLRLAHLDGLAVISFLASYLLLSGAHLEPAMWLAYPPLIYLLVRLLMVGFGRGAPSGRVAPLLSTRRLLIGLPLMFAARLAISLIGHQEIDVGYESVIGAFRILHHLPIYYNDPNHGDTYGPVVYLAYLPFQLLFPWKNSLNNLHAADAAAILFDLGTIIGLVLLGRRLRPGPAGTRLGLILAWGWTACPFTVVGLVVHTNDGLVTMLTVFALIAFARPAISGGLLGLATAAKFSPAAMLPLLASPRRRGWKGAILCAGSCGVIVGLAIYSWLPPQGFGYFWQRTIGFQLTRVDVFSPWALHPSLHPLQLALQALAVALVVAVAFVPRTRSLTAIAALAGAVTIAVQLPATHWYFYYIMWFLPFALVGLVARPLTLEQTAAEREPDGAVTVEGPRREPALVGV